MQDPHATPPAQPYLAGNEKKTYVLVLGAREVRRRMTAQELDVFRRVAARQYTEPLLVTEVNEAPSQEVG